MRKVALYCLFVMLLTIPATAFATSWAYIFVVWDGQTYEVTNDKVSAVGEQLGQVTSYSDMWPQGGNFSNHYPEGTKYFEIEGISPSEAIAVKVGIGHYKKAEKRGEYAGPREVAAEQDTQSVEKEQRSTFNKWGYVALVFLIACGFLLLKRKARNR